jgi:predicted  nucleic acid-binding Zn-ribbon protein
VLLDLGVAATEAEILIAGTPTYFAPEVAALFATRIANAPRISHKADVFSLALALRNALDPSLGRDVDRRASVDPFIEHRAENIPPFPKAADLRYLKSYFARTLSLDPDERPTATELARSLDVLLEPERKRARLRGVIAVMMPLLVIAVLATGWVYSSLTRQVKVEREAAVRASARASNLEADLGESERARVGIETETDRISALLEDGQASNAALSSRLTAAQRSLTDASGRIATLEKRIRILVEELTAVRARETTTRQQLAETTTRFEAERARASSAEQRVSTTNADLERTRAALATAHANHAATTERAAGLSADLARVESDLASVRSELAALRSDRARLESLLSNATAEAARAGNARDEAVREAEQLRRRVRELEARGATTPVPVQPAP